MKVTVCFGGTRVIVPCGSGHMLIRDLTEAAIIRYKKATGKPNDNWVTVHSLKSISDGGILDPDDQLVSVVDDKEQILAIYEEQDSTPPPIPYSCEEAGSSLGRGSEWEMERHSGRRSGGGFHRPPPTPFSYSAKPAMAVIEGPLLDSTRMGSTLPGGAVDNCVEITSLEDPPSSGLMVRGGAEPEVNGLSESSSTATTIIPGTAAEALGGPIKIECTDSNRTRTSERTGSHRKKRPAPPPPSEENEPISDMQNSSESNGYLLSPLGGKSVVGNFLRTGAPRQSSVADRWLLAQEKTAELLIREASADEVSNSGGTSGEDTLQIEIGGLPREPLGIQVAPAYGENGKLNGVVVTQIHENGRVHDDGTMRLNDRITEINNRPVYQMSFVRAQSHLHEVSQQSPITFEVVRRLSERSKSEPWLKSAGNQSSVPSKGPQSALQKANIKKIGQKMVVELKKGAQGLGFTVTSRDTAVEGERPFYIKTVLPRGAAIDDSRLMAGDRLLQVNEREVTGMSQRGVVDLLREFKQNDVVKLTISRHVEASTTSSPVPTKTPDESPPPPPVPSVSKTSEQIICPSPSLPRHLPPEKANVESLGSERQKQMLSFDVPLNATGSAGLGVSVKGRLMTNDQGKQEDSGIYIKGIIHGGAAHKDGRLKINDQLVGIEDAKLLGFSNKDAMHIIGQTMQNLEHNATSIKLVVLRVVSASSCSDTPSAPLDPQTVPPGSPDGGDSMYLDIDRSQSASSSASVIPLDARTRAFSDTEKSVGPVQPRYTIPGYGDYAVVMKGQNLVKGPHPEETTVIIEEDAGSSYKQPPSRTGNPLYEEVGSLSGKESLEDEDLFNRDAPGRRSMSEKRHGGGKTDPSHTKTFQKIKEAKNPGSHQRQHSAPVLQDVELIFPTPEESGKGTDKVEQRRSLSLESLSRIPPSNGKVSTPQQPMIHELVSRSIPASKGKKGKLPNPLKKVHRKKPTNESFRQAVDRSYQSIPGAEVGVDVEFSGEDEEFGGQTQSLPRPAKDKERRKSTGSGLIMNWFGRQFGSVRSRESSLEKKSGIEKEKEVQEIAKKAAEEEQKRIRVQYEKFKRQHQEMEKRQVPSPKIPSRWRPPPNAQPSPTSKSTSNLPSHAAPPPPYQGLRRHHNPPPPYRHGEGSRPRAPTDSCYSDRMGRSPDYEDPNNVPDWFAVAAEHRKFYRSLDRPGSGCRIGGVGGRGVGSGDIHLPGQDQTSTTQSRNGNDRTHKYSTHGGRHHIINGELDLSHPVITERTDGSQSSKSRPPPPNILPLTAVNTDAKTFVANKLRAQQTPPIPNYDQYLRSSAHNINRGKKQRPASNFYDYKTGSRQESLFQSLLGEPVYENEPLPDYSPPDPPSDSRTGFVMRM